MFRINHIEMDEPYVPPVSMWFKMQLTFIPNIQTGFHVDSPVYNSVCAHPSG